MAEIRIAFFTTDLNGEMAEVAYRSLRRYRREHPEVEITVFTSFGGRSLKGNAMGEYEIIHLPDIRDFDGVVVHSSQFQVYSVVDVIARKIYESGKEIPLISIDLPIKGADYIGTDNYGAMSEIVDHMINAHGARHLAFVEGPVDSHEAVERRRAFVDVCAKNDIPEENLTIFEGNWAPGAGAEAIKALASRSERLPDALICANDDMAIGALEEAEKHDIRIPETLMLSGFDDIDGATLFSPQITSVSRDYGGMIRDAVDHVRKEIHGERVLPSSFAGHEIKYRDSCGCFVDNSSGGARAFRKKYTEFIRTIHPEGLSVGELMGALYEAENMTDLLDRLEKSASIFGTNRFYICLNADFYEGFDHTDEVIRKTTYSDKMYLMAACPRYKEPDESHVYDVFSRRELLPKDIPANETFYTFYPLHFRQFSVGYVAIAHTSDHLTTSREETSFLMVAMAFENLRKHAQTKRLNAQLEHLYVKDSLTGVYNRFGLENEGMEMFEAMQARGETVELFFVDIDEMKAINDTYGHDAGDQSIVQTAGILERSAIAVGAQEHSFIMRYGGDEFIAFGTGLGERFEKEIYDAVIEMNRESFTPFDLSLSVGRIDISPEEKDTMENFIQRADAHMYEVKRAKKAAKKA